jgi:hypothetical protein
MNRQQGKVTFSLFVSAKPNRDIMISLSSRGVEGNGPMKPDNPPVLTGRVPIPADRAFRKMRGLSKNAQPLIMQGLFCAF